MPEWIKTKYEKLILFIDGTLIASKTESKFYDDEFFIDYQKALKEAGFWDNINFEVCISVLSEDDTLSRVNIFNDKILYYQFDAFEDDFIWTQ